MQNMHKCIIYGKTITNLNKNDTNFPIPKWWEKKTLIQYSKLFFL